jgi:hypothetical protein
VAAAVVAGAEVAGSGAAGLPVAVVAVVAPGAVVAAGSSVGYDDGRRSVTSAEVLAEVMSALGR